MRLFSDRVLAAVDLPATGVIVVGTPLGNVFDATPRLAAVLSRSGVIAAEDTRRVRALAKNIGVEITGQVVSSFDHNERDRVPQLIEAARTGIVAIVTDAGMPAISDPGFALVAAAHDESIPVTCVPGPSAPPCAIAAAGIPAAGFSFTGFAPRKPSEKKQWLEGMRSASTATVFFESPHRIAATLAVAVEVLGDDRLAAVCREMTKTHEQFHRAPLGELAEYAARRGDDGRSPYRGEITVVIGPAGDDDGGAVTVEDACAMVADLVADGVKLSTAAAKVAKVTGLRKSDVYDAAIQARS